MWGRDWQSQPEWPEWRDQNGPPSGSSAFASFPSSQAWTWEGFEGFGGAGPAGAGGPGGPAGATALPPQSLAFASHAASWSPSMVSNMMLMPYPCPQPSEQVEQHEEKRYDGTVKCFYGEKHTGHGFIFCPEIYNRTGQDVYLHARQAHRCEVGDEVSFTVVFNSRREPQARSVVKKQEEGKFLCKKREEAERQATALQQKRARPQAVEPPSHSGHSGGVMTEEQAKKFQKSLKGR
ncbi:unnamed protein product [Symbiodinium natans]|uniref:CSD domain-containing protein n=1 Tax=Symbiodinium natans TaxID=878477 RepID=A0A812M8N9_9DINO|nr:unnamed protein product [Symbiodinium natans]